MFKLNSSRNIIFYTLQVINYLIITNKIIYKFRKLFFNQLIRQSIQIQLVFKNFEILIKKIMIFKIIFVNPILKITYLPKGILFSS